MLAAMAAFIICSTAPGSAWEFSLAEEDWGPTCFANQPHAQGQITILSGENGFNPALLVSLPTYPKKTQGIAVLIRVDDGNNISLSGNVDDYFGNVYLQIKRRHIDDLMSGKKLDIAIEGGPTVSVSLKGTRRVLTKFLHCAGAK